MAASLAAAVAIAGIAATGSEADGVRAGASSDTLTALGKPIRDVTNSDGAASGGLTLDLIREFEADALAAAGYNGAGIDVALIDTGVTTVPGLHTPGKVLYGPDLSEEGAALDTHGLDTYGHGTHMAGIIAGNDGLGAAGFRGMAPDARIVSLKVAGASGETHIASVIAAIEWVVEHRNTDGLNIRVLNLALGADGVPSSLEDPLSAAVERAWAEGIVVVVAAGNRGNQSGGLDSPAVSPYVIATGALNGRAVRDGVAGYSSAGDGARNPDLVAPGTRVVSLRAPGSTLDTQNPTARIGDRFMRGSGTSQAAAVLSGSVALLLSAHPDMTPDQVKYILMNNANEVERRSTTLDGVGKVRPDSASDNARYAVDAPPQDHPRALGITSWEGVDSWTGGEWVGASWSGVSWSDVGFTGSSWS
ncbi:MAG: S8 family peptidase [Ilumatobacter sp.]|nr:S8 family peptidase [Ilumatobacter sp.]